MLAYVSRIRLFAYEIIVMRKGWICATRSQDAICWGKLPRLPISLKEISAGVALGSISGNTCTEN